MIKLLFYYDIVCPYAYLASCQIEEFAAKNNWSVEWTPILLGGLYKSHNSSQRPSEQWGEAKRALSKLDLQRQAARIKAPLSKPEGHPIRTVEAMRAICKCPKSLRVTFSKALFKAYWVDHLDISKDEIINQIANSLGIESNVHKCQEAKDALRQNTDSALEKGIFGVPSFFAKNRFWWGQDRLPLMEKHLGGKENRWPKQKKTSEKVVLYHDFSSPFSYLAYQQVKWISDAYGLEIIPKPILLGGMFRQIGTPNVPMFEMSPAKRTYALQDLRDWANYWSVDFRFPHTFPLRSILPLRVSLLAPDLTESLYKAYWVEGLNIADPAVIISIAAKRGLDGDKLCQQSQESAVKDLLKKNTQEAIEKGSCGAPTFLWREQLWWGQDRILSLIEHITQSA